MEEKVSNLENKINIYSKDMSEMKANFNNKTKINQMDNFTAKLDSSNIYKSIITNITLIIIIQT